MNRRPMTFSCEGETLAATLDQADGTIGVLFVSGGSEPRNGAFAGQSRLAARIAARGYPVFRFDRRGVGDSSGENAGFRESAPDIEAAIALFRTQCQHVRRIVAFGNCDAAAALMLGSGFELDALVLANPWTFDDDTSQEASPDAIKARYLEKLRNPREIARLVTGKVSLSGVAKSLKRAATTKSSTTQLGEAMAASLAQYQGDARILLAGRDRTGQAFRVNYPIADESIATCADADHAFSAPDHKAWLEEQIVEVLLTQS
jgi:exosortase A-associated hydrolase 1